MGLSVHYKGKLKQADLLPELIEEIKDVADVYRWKYHIFNAKFPNKRFANHRDFDEIYGINFTPHNSETFSFAFLSNGVMVCPARVQIWADEDDETKQNYIFTTSVKTQYAGEKTHQLVIQFIRYLNKKYFVDFEMMDESRYWETADEKIMHEKFQEYENLMDNFTLALETFPPEKNEDIQTYFERLMQHVNKLKKQ